METGRTALQLARIPVLLLLLRATGWYVEAVNHHQGPGRLDMEALRVPWAAVSLVSVLFVTVMLGGRRWRHAWPVLAAEALLAAVLAFVPPWPWIASFKIGGWQQATQGGFMQPLAVAWLGVVVLSGFHQLREAGTPAPGGSSGGDESSGGADERSLVESA